jgi:3-deoxy-manno-octulosonate cytidylyltransferase (CMP-KDO synthetase)
MGFKVVIPARYASTRLPGKPLLAINGKPMVQWVVEAAGQSGAEEVLVATDDVRIQHAVKTAPGKPVAAVMTAVEHRSGTDRIAEVAALKHWSDDTIVVNVQGDEPQMPATLIDQVAQLLAAHPEAAMATLSTPIDSLEEFLNPNVVKVVADANGLALYFSRAPIPWYRDHAASGIASQQCFAGAQRHLGIYAYRVRALRQITQMSPGDLELAESLEQLRALQAGLRIAVAEAQVRPGIGVDTPHDIERIRLQINQSNP